MLGLLVGFAGLILLVMSSMNVSTSAEMKPLEIGALLLAALLWSIGSIYSRDADMPTSSLLGTALRC